MVGEDSPVRPGDTGNVSADRPGPSTRARVWALNGDGEVRRRDTLFTEEPL